MTIWIDAQFSPAIAAWIQSTLGVNAIALRDLGLRDAEDEEIFAAAKTASVIVMSKDEDFLNLLARFGTPPQILWITCGNTSNAKLKEILAATLLQAIDLFSADERLVEISDI